MARILVCDDAPDWRSDLVDQVQSFGHHAEAVATLSELRSRLAEGWDGLLLDQRLSGDEGPDDGLDLIATATAMGVRVLVVTGFVSREAVERAYEAGAWDYVEKRATVYAVLKLKLRQLTDAARGWETVARTADQRAEALHAAHGRLGAPTAAARGLALEEFVTLLAGTIPGFVVRNNTRTTDEELDLAVRNESSDPFWSTFGPYVLFECKNRKEPATPEHFDRLRAKMGRRYGLVKLAFLVSTGGFTEGVRTHAEAARESGHAIVLVDGADLGALLTSPEHWKRLVDRQIAGR